MKRIKEINWECRSKWSEELKFEYKTISNWVISKYFNKLKDNEMLDLESITIFGRDPNCYRIEFKIRIMSCNVILGSHYVLARVPHDELWKMEGENNE